MKKSIVAVLKTKPETVIKDYRKLMNLINYKKYINKRIKTIIKLNLSWSLYFPACSTEPWQLHAIAKILREDKYKDIIAVENQTVVTHPWKGAYNNKWLPILEKYNILFQPLTDVKWIKYKPKAKMLAMYDIFDEILIPEIFINSNVIHLPTLKTHGHTIITGAIKNAFGGLIPKYRHHAHLKIHEILVDLLAIQQEIHKGIVAVTDGTVAGNLAGPRTMKPFIGNVILASNDQVAIDAIAAKIMGFDPFKIKFLKLAHDKNLGNADLKQVEIVGMSKKEFNKLNFNFKVKKSPVIKWDQILRKKTVNIPWLHKLLFKSLLFKLFIHASEIYHDKLWYRTKGKQRIVAFLKTPWGKLFKSYKRGPYPKFREVKEWDPY